MYIATHVEYTYIYIHYVHLHIFVAGLTRSWTSDSRGRHRQMSSPQHRLVRPVLIHMGINTPLKVDSFGLYSSWLHIFSIPELDAWRPWISSHWSSHSWVDWSWFTADWIPRWSVRLVCFRCSKWFRQSWVMLGEGIASAKFGGHRSHPKSCDPLGLEDWRRSKAHVSSFLGVGHPVLGPSIMSAVNETWKMSL